MIRYTAKNKQANENNQLRSVLLYLKRSVKIIKVTTDKNNSSGAIIDK